jgi:hypothetical protein
LLLLQLGLWQLILEIPNQPWQKILSVMTLRCNVCSLCSPPLRYRVSYRTTDIDSTAHLVSEGEHLPFQLFYYEAFDDGVDGEIKDLLINGVFWLFKTGSVKSDLNKSFAYLLKAKPIVDKITPLILFINFWIYKYSKCHSITRPE